MIYRVVAEKPSTAGMKTDLNTGTLQVNTLCKYIQTISIYHSKLIYV
jgi:hypothetical protein